MDGPFGGSAGLLQRLRPTRVEVEDLHEVACALLGGAVARHVHGAAAHRGKLLQEGATARVER